MTQAAPGHSWNNAVIAGSGTAFASVDIAGVAWPVYKVEALAAGLLTFVGVLILVGTLQAAVLVGAAVTVAVWWGLRWQAPRTARQQISPGQAARTQ